MKNICIPYLSGTRLRKYCVFFLVFCSAALNASDFDLIMERIRTANTSVNITSVENTTAAYLQSVQANGSFADIDYSDQSVTNWQPQTHLDRLKPVVQAYTLPSSKYYADESVYNNIVNMLTFWHDAHPVSSNWYMGQIGSPQRMGIMLILLRYGPRQLPAELEANLIERMKTEGGDPLERTGANKLDVATHWIYRGCLTADAGVLGHGVSQVYETLAQTTDEGFQADYSYHQHGSQLYLGGYGRVAVAGVSNLAIYLTGTPYALSGDNLALLSKFVREVYIPVIRGKYLMYNTLGRGFTRKNALDESGFSSILNRMISLDPQYKSFYEKSIERLKGNKAADYEIVPLNSHLWRSDYTLHQRPAYTMDVRMASVFTTRNENGNDENLKGYFLTDGATQIVRRGDEYIGIFPVWDWAKIPGTTAPDMAAIPMPPAWGVSGGSYFAGGVSDGRYGVSAYLLNDTKYEVNTKAKKSWFFFDDEIVCLGAAIASSAAYPVNTTVNQTLLKGDVTLVTADGTASAMSQQQETFGNLSWILHDNVGYYFPEGENITVSRSPQTGTWYSINKTQTSESITKDVFKTWFNHGDKPSAGTYSYIIVPGKATAAEINAYPSGNIEILANTDSLQVVRHKTLNMLGLVFYKDATFSADGIYVHADKACVLMLRDIDSESVKAYIADPSRRNNTVTIRTELPGIDGKKETECALTVYPDPYAGQTSGYVIDKNSPGYVPVSGRYIYPQADSYVRSGSYRYDNYGEAKTLAVKNDAEGYAREAYLKFDLQDLDADMLDRVYLTLYVASTNTAIHQTQWNIGHVSDDSWLENSITWYNKPPVDDLIATIPASFAGTSVTADITEFVVSEIKFGNKLISLHVSSAYKGSTTDAAFHSKEAELPTAPRLLIETLLPSGITENNREQEPSLKIYPSVASRGEAVSVETEGISRIRVVDIFGKTALSVAAGDKIDTGGLSPGVYVVLGIDSLNTRILNSKLIVR